MRTTEILPDGQIYTATSAEQVVAYKDALAQITTA